jgi:NAD(P)-dependent dehydrogenase (short-subunit alcohol dehydrogenase family)
VRRFWADPASPERQDPLTLGSALFNTDTFEEWDSLFEANTTSIYFVTLAFLELLQKGTKGRADYSASVTNITSCVGFTKSSVGLVRANLFLFLSFLTRLFVASIRNLQRSCEPSHQTPRN